MTALPVLNPVAKIFPWLFHSRPRTIFIIVNNKNQLKIFVKAAELLREAGLIVQFCLPSRSNRKSQAPEHLEQLGLSYIPFHKVIATIRDGDVLVTSLDSGPKRVSETVRRLEKTSVQTIGVVEGCRFAQRRYFRHAKHVLVWGGTGKEWYESRARIVGSPVIETMNTTDKPKENSDLAVINYKFTFYEKRLDPNQTWLSDAIQACRSCGIRAVVSAHPHMRQQVDGVEVSAEPIEDLLRRAKFLISRSSTVVYQALAVETQPFFYAVKDENMCEFADPMGAYPIVQSGPELESSLRDWLAGAKTYNASGFLERHVDRDGDKSASTRMAEEILDIYWNEAST